MPSNDVFFADQSEQSAVKAHIVSSYFSAWSRVIQKWNTPMAYIDLFCGPGKYENDKPSAPFNRPKYFGQSSSFTQNEFCL